MRKSLLSRSINSLYGTCQPPTATVLWPFDTAHTTNGDTVRVRFTAAPRAEDMYDIEALLEHVRPDPVMVQKGRSVGVSAHFGNGMSYNVFGVVSTIVGDAVTVKNAKLVQKF